MKIRNLAPARLTAYKGNSRTHSPEQIAQIVASIKEFGFTNPILIDEDLGVIAGHGRLAAAEQMALATVPTITLDGLTEDQKRAYVIADNSLALNAGWDMDLLKLEIDVLEDHDFNLDLLGFDEDFWSELLADDAPEIENPYSMDIAAPTYQPSDRKPNVADLVSLEKTKELLARIKASDAKTDEKRFLRLAAERHTVFDFASIADYYAHSNAEVQALMEESGLVIIDFKKAIEHGFVQVSQRLGEQYEDENGG